MQRAPVVGGLLKVAGQMGASAGQGLGARPAWLPRLARRAMQPPPVGAHQGVIDAVLNERVAKQIFKIGHAGGEPDDVGLFKLAELRLEGWRQRWRRSTRIYRQPYRPHQYMDRRHLA